MRPPLLLIHNFVYAFI
ncbi:putative membrane protein, partial [Vibrio parahaemolyticus EKP-021]